MTKLFICLDRGLGTIIASDQPLNSGKYIECDGRTIKKSDYPEVFKTLGKRCEMLKLPDYRNILKSEVYFYMIVAD